MKIKTSLLVLSATFIVLIAAIGFITFGAFRRINAEVEEGRYVNELIEDVLGLDMVTYEFLTYHEKRMLEQWTLKYDSIGKLLERMKREETHPKHISLLGPMTSDYEALGSLFSQLQTNFIRRKRLVEEKRPETEIDLSLVLERRIIAQTLMRSQEITSTALELSAMTEQIISRTQQRASSLIVVSIMVLAVFSACISFITIRGVTRPVEELVRGAEIIGHGDLGHRVDVKTRNEIGELAAAFNQMTERRQQADDELRKLNVELERRVLERTAELSAANKELESFSYSVSHDLRAPLRSMDGFSQALLEDCGDQLDEHGKDYLGRVRRASQRMAALIEDILRLSRVSRTEMKREKVDLSQMAEIVVSERQGSDRTRNVEVSIKPDMTIEGDPRLLHAVLENLLDNAWKFTGKQRDARVEVGSTQTDGKQVFYVKDNGAGFDMEYADKLFGAFQRLHSTDQFPGTGIGLATVQRIIRRHGGKIWAEGGVERGATFYFTLG